MIEQTELVVTTWHYHPPEGSVKVEEKISQFIVLDTMKKRAGIKKGIACRFSCRFATENDTILEYIAEDSYVIDLEDKIDKKELLTMIRNSYSKFTDTFDLRKLGTVLRNRTLRPLAETGIDLDAIVPMLE